MRKCELPNITLRISSFHWLECETSDGVDTQGSHHTANQPVLKKPSEVRPLLSTRKTQLTSASKIQCPDVRAAESRRVSPFRILILDDEPLVVKSISMILTSIGHRGVECHHPLEARKRLQAEKFDLLISDYKMPDITGLELIRMLRADRCNIPVLLVTAYLSKLDLANLVQNGVHCVLEKPFDLNSFQKALSKIIAT